MTKGNQIGTILKKKGKWGALIAFGWITLNIIIPLALLRIPAVKTYLVLLNDQLPFNIPGVG